MVIYVGNLPSDVSEDEMRKEFTRFGQVASVHIMNDRYIGSGQTRVYGYVVMPSHNEGMEAIYGMQGKIMKNRMLQVIEALPLSNLEANRETIGSSRRYGKKPRQRLAQ